MAGWQDFTQLVQSFLAADLLTSDLSGVLNLSLNYLPTIEHNVGSLSIALETQVAGTITVQVVDATGIVPTWTQRKTSSAFGQVLSFTSPYAYTTASALSITITSSVNQVHNCPTFIWGYGEATPGQQGVKLLRPDGRDYPLGSQFASAAALTAADVTVIAAPASPGRILLASLTGTSSANAGGFTATINGSSVSLFGFGVSGLLANIIPAGGLLLDPATPLNVHAAAGVVVICNAMYDIVT